MKHLKQMLMNEREKYGKAKESKKMMKSGDELNEKIKSNKKY